MPATFSRIKTWVSNEVLTASDLNAEINNLLNNTIPASIDDYSADVATMQTSADPGGVGTESLATTLAGELQRLRFIIKAIKGSAQWYSSGVRNFGTSALAILAGDISTDAVTTVKILDANVTRAKLVAVGQQLSSSSGATSTTSATYVQVTNLTVTITTTGRPVVLAVVPDGSASLPYLTAPSGDTVFAIHRDATSIAIFRVPAVAYSIDGAKVTVDVVAAGTYTYTVQYKASAGTFSWGYHKLLAYEL